MGDFLFWRQTFLIDLVYNVPRFLILIYLQINAIGMFHLKTKREKSLLISKHT